MGAPHWELHSRPSTDRLTETVDNIQSKIGITRAAIYKAIEKGALEAIRIGNVTVVSRASAHAYRQRRESLDRPESRARVPETPHRSETRRQRHADSTVARAGG
jgi:hypothetical protein